MLRTAERTAHKVQWLQIVIAALVLSLAMPVLSNAAGEHGQGCGDVFGDLVHILRDDVTGQPIYQEREIELPEDAIGTGYCPIAVDANGQEIGFVELTCDPAVPENVVEVDYFGRLNGGRTKERNLRMHFDEVISSIKDADKVKQDVTGRLMLGYDCGEDNGNGCTWSTVDSPMESLGLYVRLMKYGHLQTDPMEEDIWAHGDPAQGTQYHPTLEAADWDKFSKGLRKHLAPEGLNYAQYEPESLTSEDFTRAAIFLGAAANKTGKVTVDLVQYANRFLKITLDTETTRANLDTLPALVREEGGDIRDAGDDEVAESFVDFEKMEYDRVGAHEETLEVIRPGEEELVWIEDAEVELLDWLAHINGAAPEGDAANNIDGFVGATSDTVRAIQFIHNYDIPEDLGWDFGAETE